MHRIRLREPWAASLSADEAAIVYTRKFHRPTGVDEQAVTLKVCLIAVDLPNRDKLLTIILNGEEIESQMVQSQPFVDPDSSVFFPLAKLEPFNSLEIRVPASTPTIGTSSPSSDATVIPTFGSFVIESVELQIE